jgi:hypothetical protein
MLHTRHAVLSGNVLTVLGDSRELKRTPGTLEDLCKLSYQFHLTHLWVASGHSVICSREAWEGFSIAWDGLPNWKEGHTATELVSFIARKREEAGKFNRLPNVNIIFIEHSLWAWNIPGLEPGEVLGIIKHLEEKTGTPIGGSPAGVGMRLLKEINCQPKKLTNFEINKSTIDLSSIPFEKAARPLLYERIPSEQELAQARLIVAKDKNSAYSRAAREYHVGIGTPVYLEAGTKKVVAFNHQLPGIWRLEVNALPEGEIGEMLARGLLPAPIRKPGEWIATPIVKLMMQMGYKFSIVDAWVFPTHAAIFRVFVETLWEYRQSYEEGSKMRSTFKQIMNDTIGFTRNKALPTDSYKFRPDWSSQIVSGSFALMMYNMIKDIKNGRAPFLAYVDSLFYLSTEEQAEKALPEGSLDNSTGLGGYKLHCALPVDDELRNLLRTPSSKVNKLARFNQMIRELENNA